LHNILQLNINLSFIEKSCKANHAAFSCNEVNRRAFAFCWRREIELDGARKSDACLCLRLEGRFQEIGLYAASTLSIQGAHVPVLLSWHTSACR